MELTFPGKRIVKNKCYSKKGGNGTYQKAAYICPVFIMNTTGCLKFRLRSYPLNLDRVMPVREKVSIICHFPHQSILECY